MGGDLPSDTPEGVAEDDDFINTSTTHYDPEQETHLERVWNRVRNYGFSIGDWNLVLAAGLYSEVLTKPAIAPLPNSPDYFSGLTNVRGNLVPVYRLDLWLGSNFSPAGSKRGGPGYALLIDSLSSGAAVMIDNKPRALELGKFALLENLPDAMPELLRTVVDRVYESDEGYWYLIDHQALFARLSGPVAREEQTGDHNVR